MKMCIQVSCLQEKSGLVTLNHRERKKKFSTSWELFFLVLFFPRNLWHNRGSTVQVGSNFTPRHQQHPTTAGRGQGSPGSSLSETALVLGHSIPSPSPWASGPWTIPLCDLRTRCPGWTRTGSRTPPVTSLGCLTGKSQSLSCIRCLSLRLESGHQKQEEEMETDGGCTSINKHEESRASKIIREVQTKSVRSNLSCVATQPLFSSTLIAQNAFMQLRM